ncbi:MAG: hypothetical protein K940chlam7_00307 [Chlamydiae bacterium]|nr:hypothetical protein [Chlamydiota bacterium]
MKKYFLIITITIICLLFGGTTLYIKENGSGDFYRMIAELSDDTGYYSFGKMWIQKSIAVFENDSERAQDLSRAYKVYGNIYHH